MGTPRKYKVLVISTHPVQYASPLYRRMARDPRLEVLTAYCSLQGAEPGFDPGFGVEVAWDIPLLEGHPWVQVPNRSLRPGLGRFFGLVNPQLWRLVCRGDFDAVVIHTGYKYATFWIVALAAKLSGKPLLFGTDAHELNSQDNRAWKKMFKRHFWPVLFRLADVVIVTSSRSVALMQSLGIREDRVALTPYVVDNDWWIEQVERVDRPAVRRGWGVPECARVILFCAKLQSWKRPQDALQAFAKAHLPETFLVYVGEGPLRSELEAEARARGVAAQVRFLGFVNQSKLPAIYGASDLLVLPSQYEAFGVVVNEAMLCGCAVAVSDRVGAVQDLVRPGETGFVFPVGDVDALVQILRQAVSNPNRLKRVQEAARKRMENWSPREYVSAFVRAVETALQAKVSAAEENRWERSA